MIAEEEGQFFLDVIHGDDEDAHDGGPDCACHPTLGHRTEDGREVWLHGFTEHPVAPEVLAEAIAQVTALTEDDFCV